MVPRPPDQDCFFVSDGRTFVPTGFAQGPWGPSLAGNYIGGLLGRSIETAVQVANMRPSRLTVDLLHPVGIRPVEVRTSIVRQGRKLAMVDAAMLQDDRIVARASALFLKPEEHNTESAWSTSVLMPPLPVEHEHASSNLPMFMRSYGRDPIHGSPGVGIEEWCHDGPKYVWLRETKPLVDDEPLSPFVRAAMAGDVTSALTHWSTAGLQYINADYTITLSRLPHGTYLGLASVTHYSHAGVASGVATLFDHDGPIGSGMSTSIAHPGFTPPRSLQP